jgi:putative ABC transport system ATP-binding protein
MTSVALDTPGARPATTGPPAATARGLVWVHGRGEAAVRALDGVDLTLPTGAFTAIMGPSGSGKSTLLHCLAGLDRPTAGSVHIGDHEVSALAEQAVTRVRRDHIGFVFQSFNLLPTLTARENMLLPLSLAGRRPDPAWFDHLVSVLGLGERLGHRPAELSGGQQQRVAIGRALLSRPTIVLADEPTGALDSRSAAQVLTFLRHAVDELGQTVVLVTHDPLAASRADRVVFLADGRIVGEEAAPTAERVLDRLRGLGA